MVESNKIVSSFLRDKGLIFKGLLDVDDVSDSILINLHDLIPSPVDFLGLDELSIWGNAMLSTELKACLGVLDSSDQGSSDGLSLEDQWKLGDGVGLWGETELDDGTVHIQEGEVVSNLMVGTDGVQDQVKLTSLSSH